CQRLDAGQAARIRDHTGDRARGGGQGRGEEGPAALALATLEVAVAGADGVLPGLELVAVHGDAHRAAGLTPFRTGRLEDLRQALALGLALHLVRTRYDHQAHALGDAAVLEDAGREAQVADPPVRAAAHEDDVDLLAEDRLPGLEVHVLEGTLERSPLTGVGLIG